MTDIPQPPDEAKSPTPLTRREARAAAESLATVAMPAATSAVPAEATAVRVEATALPAEATTVIDSTAGQGAAGATPSGEPPAAASAGGIGAMIRKHPTAWLAGALGLAFLLLGTGAVVAGIAVGSGGSQAAIATTPTPTVEPPRTLPGTIAAPSRLRTCSVVAAASDPRLAQFSGFVMNANTGEVLFDRGGTTPARTGSVLKVLTASAALSVLGPAFQLTTKVVSGSSPGAVVLVGGGDATISALPVGAESFYKGAPKMIDLATQVMAARGGEPVTEVVLDASYWNSADRWDPAWKRSEQTIGYHSEVTALQVDGDRADPTQSTSPRSTDPIGRAGAAFIAALAEAGNTGEVTVTEGSAVSTTVLGEVKSQPLSVLINQMLLVSDNTLAEMIARVTSRASGLDGSAASLQQAIPAALTIYEVDVAGLVIKDGSGLSEFNSVPPAYVAQLMIKVLQGGQNLNFVYAGLPVAGKSGSLASRFSGANAVARGAVVAKTGWIDTAYSLAGIVTAADTTPLTFTFYAIGDVSDNAKEALDTLTTAVFTCGDNLSNN